MIITVGVGIYMGISGSYEDTEFVKAIKKQAEAQKAAKALRDSINGDTLKETVKLIKDSIQ